MALSKNPNNQTTNMQSGFKDIRFESLSFHGVTEIGAENDLPGHPVLPESAQMVLCGRGRVRALGFDELSTGGTSFASPVSWPPNCSYCLEMSPTPSQSFPLLPFISLLVQHTHRPLTRPFVSSSFHPSQRLACHAQGVPLVPDFSQYPSASHTFPRSGSSGMKPRDALHMSGLGRWWRA